MWSLRTSACQAKVSIVLVKSHPLAVVRASPADSSPSGRQPLPVRDRSHSRDKRSYTTHLGSTAGANSRRYTAIADGIIVGGLTSKCLLGNPDGPRRVILAIGRAGGRRSAWHGGCGRSRCW